MRLCDTLLDGSHGFRAAFILYGITRLDDCARDPVGTSRINVSSIKTVIEDLAQAGIKPVFASSDAVFDGSAGMRKESDPTRPILTYGKQKREVELYLEGSKASWIIARLSKLVSARPEPRNLLNEWAEQLERGTEIRCATDLIFSPADVDDTARALIRLAEAPFTGIYHVCGPDTLRRLELLDLLLQAIRERRHIVPKIVVCRMADLGLSEARPLDVSMSAHKLYSDLDIAFRSMQAVCRDLADYRYVRHAPAVR